MSAWALYDELISAVPEDLTVEEAVCGMLWTMVRASNGGVGLAMTTNRHGVPMRARELAGMSLRRAAELVRSWSFIEAGLGAAAMNAFYNTPERMEKLGARENPGRFCTDGIPHEGARVCLVGALRHPEGTFDGAASIVTLEREDLPETYPDSAAEFLLPGCDIAVITGSAMVNKTLPRLLELSVGAHTVITGPTTPLAQPLLRFGAGRLAGLVITDPDGCRAMVCEGYRSSPYRFGTEYFLDA